MKNNHEQIANKETFDASIYYIVYVKPYTGKGGKQWNIGDVREMQGFERNPAFDDIVKRFSNKEQAENYSAQLTVKLITENEK